MMPACMPDPSPPFTNPGRRIRIPRWVFGDRCVVRVEVEAVIPDADPSEPCLEPSTLRCLDQVQQWINTGQDAQLDAAGTVYINRPA